MCKKANFSFKSDLNQVFTFVSEDVFLSLLEKAGPKFLFYQYRTVVMSCTYMSSSLLKKRIVVYHAALWFVTGASVHKHHCNLYEMVQWTSLGLRRRAHVNFQYKSSGPAPTVRSPLKRYTSSYGTRLSENICSWS